MHLDTKNGVNLKVFYTSIPSAATAPLTGIAPVTAAAAPPNVIESNTKNKKMTDFAPVLWSATSFVAVKSGGDTLASYKGDHFGGQPTSTGAFLLAKIYASQHGLSLTKDFKYDPGSPPALIALMERGSTPISLDFDPFTAELLYTGKYKVVANLDTYFQKTIGNKAFKAGVGSLVTWAQANPKLVVDIRKAFLEANNDIASGKAKSFFMANADKYFGIKNPKEAAFAWNRVKEDYVTFWGPKLWTPQVKLLKQAQKLGLVPQNVSVNVFWNK